MSSKFIQNALVVLLGGLVFLCLFAPLQQSQPSDSQRVVRIGRAPFWTLPRTDGSSLDVREFGVECAFVAGVSLVVGFLSRD
jgi:hypothetical protein